MAKRGAEQQISKDDFESRRGGDSDEDPGERDAPLAPIEGRKIRGMPKRGKSSAPAVAPTPSTPASTNEAAPKPAAFSGFAFGSAQPSTSTPAAAPASTPFSGFSFSKPAASTPAAAPSTAASPFSGFSFGASTAPASATSTSEKKSSDDAEAPAAKKPFSGFAFGAQPTPAAPTSTEPKAPATFSFAPAAAKPASNEEIVPSTSNNAFGASSGSTTSPFFFGQSATPSPAVSSGTAPANTVPVASKSAEAKASAFTPSLANPPPEGEVSYYTSIRGLNTSILAFLTTTLENDAFTNLGEVLPGLVEQYNKHLKDASDKAGWKPASSSTSSTVPQKAEEPKKTGFSMPVPPATGFSMPAAPSGGFAFGGQSTATKAPPASTGKGFTPSLPASGASASASPFSFGAKPAETPKKPSAAVTKMVEDVLAEKPEEEAPEEKKSEEKKNETPAKAFSFSFGGASSTPQSTEKKSGAGLFSFAPSGPLHPSTPDSKSFSPSTNIQNASSSTPPAKLGKFGPGGSAPQLSFGGATATGTPSSTPGATKAGFNFGAPSSGGAGFSIGSGVPFPSESKVTPGGDKPAPAASPFSFSTPASTEKKDDKPAPSFSFGSTSIPAASKPASTGFSFGSAAAPTSSFSFGVKAPASTFSFGAKTDTTSTFTPSFGQTPAASTSTPAPASTTEPSAEAASEETAEGSGEPSVNLAEEGGAGEEGEDTLFQVRTKLHKLDNGKYVSVGLGQLKLKQNKETGKRRLLLRTDGNGNVVLNMSVTDKLEPKAEGKSVKFLGFDLEGKPMGYLLQIKTADAAKEAAEAIRKEVEAVKKG